MFNSRYSKSVQFFYSFSSRASQSLVKYSSLHFSFIVFLEMHLFLIYAFLLLYVSCRCLNLALSSSVLFLIPKYSEWTTLTMSFSITWGTNLNMQIGKLFLKAIVLVSWGQISKIWTFQTNQVDIWGRKLCFTLVTLSHHCLLNCKFPWQFLAWHSVCFSLKKFILPD